MPRQARVQEKGPAEGREGGERVTEASPAKDLGQTYAALLQGWSDFYRDMGSRLTETFGKQQKAYEDLFAKWNEFAGSAGRIVEGVATDESQRELYDVWRNYSNKLGSRMTRATTEGMKGYNEVAVTLERYASRIAEMGQQMAVGRVEAPRAEEVYETWLDIVGKLRQQMERAASLNREELEELSKTWLEFSAKMEALSAQRVGQDGALQEFVDLWAKQARDVGQAMADFIKGHDHEHDETRKTWTDHFLKMQGSMEELARAIGLSFEDMYRRWLEGGGTSLSDLPLFPWWAPREQGESVKDLKRRIEELEKKAGTPE